MKTTCDTCAHNRDCGYFDYNEGMTEEEAFIEYCIGCCCGDGFMCNRGSISQTCGNWEDQLILG